MVGRHRDCVLLDGLHHRMWACDADDVHRHSLFVMQEVHAQDMGTKHARTRADGF